MLFFIQLDKVIELSQKLQELEDNLQATVKSSFEQFTSTQPDCVSSPSSSHMHLHDEETSNSRCRQVAPNTPTRQFLTQPVAGNSPVIAVRLYYYYAYHSCLSFYIGS